LYKRKYLTPNPSPILGEGKKKNMFLIGTHAILLYMVRDENILFSWDMPEFHYKDRKVDWYWWVGLVALAGVALSIFLWHNYIFAVFVFLAGVIVIAQARRQPGMIPFNIGDNGITYHGKHFSFDTLTYFWIEPGTETTNPHLFFHSDSQPRIFDAISIPEDIDIIELRTALLEVIEEREMKESFVTRMFRKIGM
jgi:hypothetical protein